MSTKTKQKKKTSTKYDLCCLSVMSFSYPAAPYRVYIAESTNGQVIGRYEARTFGSRAEAERWLNQNCRYWTFCHLP
jgi:hypothetical protein